MGYKNTNATLKNSPTPKGNKAVGMTTGAKLQSTHGGGKAPPKGTSGSTIAKGFKK